VTLFLAAEDDEADTERLETATERLRAAGLTVRTEVATGGSPFDALIDAATDHDAIVMGERAPSFRSLVFDDEADRVAEASVGPVVVVRNHDESGG